MSAHLKNFEVQYLSNKASDHPVSYMLMVTFSLFQAIVSVFKISSLRIWPNLSYTNKTPLNLYVAKL